jgi:hypothetical protein
MRLILLFRCASTSFTCRTINSALTDSLDGTNQLVQITILSDYDTNITTSVPVGIELYIHSPSNGSTQSSLKYSTSTSSNTNLFAITTGQFEILNLKLLYGGGSKGSFISLTGEGLGTIANSNITTDSLGGSTSSLIQVTGNGEIILLNVQISNLILSISGGSSTVPLIYLLGNSSLRILSNNVSSISSNSSSGVVFSDVKAASPRKVQILLNSSIIHSLLVRV